MRGSHNMLHIYVNDCNHILIFHFPHLIFKWRLDIGPKLVLRPSAPKFGFFYNTFEGLW